MKMKLIFAEIKNYLGGSEKRKKKTGLYESWTHDLYDTSTMFNQNYTAKTELLWHWLRKGWPCLVREFY